MRRALAGALVALAACGVSDGRVVATGDVRAMRAHDLDAASVAGPVVAERDPLPTKEPVRLIPSTGASRGARRSPAPVVASGDIWTRLAMCESGMRNIRNHPYSGYFQFIRSTWQSLGYSGEAADHPFDVQLAGAKRLLARSGPGQWPVCSRKVGLR